MGQKFTEQVASFLFEYDTPRMVLVRNKKVGLTFRACQLVVLAYIIGWVFLYEKGYQSTDTIVSSVSVKLKGLTVTNSSEMGPHIWDVADYVFPPQGDSSFVVMTNFIVTHGQKQGVCPENPEAGKCEKDSNCTVGKYHRKGQGIVTGKCVNFSRTEKTCEIFGWCPVEVDDNIPEPPLLLAAENFTLFIKNSITFPRFKVSRRNLVERVTKDYMNRCTYHTVKDPLCPVFKLGDVVMESGQNFSSVAVKGGAVGITITWNCDLDWTTKYCVPVYRFHGLYEDKNLSPGFNFRFAKYYRENGTDFRSLYKVFGIRFDILVDGKAGKFDIIPTMTTIGSGIGIFGVASVLCDLLLLYFLPKRAYYKQKKFKYAEQDSLRAVRKHTSCEFFHVQLAREGKVFSMILYRFAHRNSSPFCSNVLQRTLGISLFNQPILEQTPKQPFFLTPWTFIPSRNREGALWTPSTFSAKDTVCPTQRHCCRSHSNRGQQRFYHPPEGSTLETTFLLAAKRGFKDAR